jgi:Helix-turn-helix.
MILHRNTVNINRNVVLKMVPVQCKMARAALGLGVRELAEAAQVSPDTIARLERGEELKPRTIAAVQSALEAAGVEFIPENGGGPGVRLRRDVKK